VLADASVALDDTTLVVRTPTPDLRPFSSQHLLITRSLAGTVWPEGTGTHRVVQADVLRLDPVAAGTAPSFRIRVATPAIARNRIDDGIDVVLTGDPATAAYASRQMSAPILSLDWDRTWVLLVALRVPALDDGRLRGLRTDLSRDALRANARSAVTPEWTTEAAICGTASTSGAVVGRIIHDPSDPTARTIAERLAAVNSLPVSDPASLPILQDPSATATVLAVPYRSARECADVIPLVDTRWQAVVGAHVKRIP
jgi:hypothetical protein